VSKASAASPAMIASISWNALRAAGRRTSSIVRSGVRISSRTRSLAISAPRPAGRRRTGRRASPPRRRACGGRRRRARPDPAHQVPVARRRQVVELAERAPALLARRGGGRVEDQRVGVRAGRLEQRDHRVALGRRRRALARDRGAEVERELRRPEQPTLVERLAEAPRREVVVESYHLAPCRGSLAHGGEERPTGEEVVTAEDLDHDPFRRPWERPGARRASRRRAGSVARVRAAGRARSRA
jgi:hypothetical protein